ncbi:MAG: Txe/YoeB family addiction module toxin [Bacteroidetes bacterium]|nr:Txe/YoeB family addiction module toxin [Bacteroidota bacterium]
MRDVVFQPKAYEDFSEWLLEDVNIAIKINRLLKDINRTPFTGLGKPEPLKYELKGYWSRRISLGHRLVYKVTKGEITVNSCKYHY